MIVSVVVPTYKRPELLNRCLAALLAQDLDATQFEIVIADDAASEETRQLVEWWTNSPVKNGPLPRLRYVAVQGGHGPAIARNAGWRAARGKIIAFTDDDCIPDPAWLRAGIAHFRNNVSGVQGRVVMPVPDPPTDYELDASKLQEAEFVTANCFVRREALEEAGGFDERFRLAWREDSDLYFTLLNCNKKIVRATDVIVVHPVRPGEWGISVKQQHKAMFNALLYKKHPELYRTRVHPATPVNYYAIVISLLSAFALQVAGLSSAALIGAGLWLGLTTAFCLRRLQGTSHSLKHVSEMLVTSIFIPPLSVYWRLRGAFKFRVPFL